MLLGVAAAGCSGSDKDTDSAPDSAGPDLAMLMVTLVLDRSGCDEDPHDHTFEVEVHTMPERVAVVTFESSLDATTSVELPSGVYGVYAQTGWSPDGPQESGWTSSCGCITTLDKTKEQVELAAGETVAVTAPVVCGSTLPD